MAAVVVAVLLTGCQPGSPSGRGKPAGWVPSALPAYTATVQPAAVRTREAKGYSRILTTTQGLSIHVNDGPSNRAVCTGSCTSVWHPVLVNLGDLIDPGDLFITGSSSGRICTWRAVRVQKDAPGQVVFKPRK